MRIPTGFLRRVHKWVGLVLGVQFLVWTVSGAMMALLPMEEVAGGRQAEIDAAPLPPPGEAWGRVRQALGGAQVTGISVRPLLGQPIFEVSTPRGVRLFRGSDGQPFEVDAALARRVAEAAHPGSMTAVRVEVLRELTLPVREHALPIWRVDFADEGNSSFYVSAATGQLLERRNDTWRLWDFFWMLHNMDYANRTSFNHPLIVMVGFGVLWLAVTGFYLLFRTSWRPEARMVRRLRERSRGA